VVRLCENSEAGNSSLEISEITRMRIARRQ
jgi:hypothetical protein